MNIKATIYNAILEKIFRIQKLADYDNANLKTILSLIVLDDLIDWGMSKEESKETLKHLKYLQHQILEKNKDIEPIMDNSRLRTYTNVNLPQTNTTWARL